MIPLYVFKYSGDEEFDILMAPLKELGYSFKRAPSITVSQHETSMINYIKNYTSVTVYLNSDRLFFGDTKEFYSAEDRVLTFLAPYTKEVKDTLINNLKHEKDN